MTDIRKRLSVIIGALALQLNWLPATASEPPVSPEETESITNIDKLSRLILLKEIDLERAYTTFRMTATFDPKWRHVRYFLCQEAAAGLFLANEGSTMIESAKHLKSPQNVSTPVMKASAEAGLIGSILDGGSSAFELGSNSLIALWHKLSKTDPESTRKQIFARLKEIDSLSEQRNALVETAPPRERALWEKEGSLLKAYRDWCVYEFATVYADSKSYQASNNIYYALSASALSLYVISYVQTIRSYKDPSFLGPSAVNSTVGSSIGLFTTPLSLKLYTRMYNYWFQKLSRQLNEKIVDNEVEAKAAMNDLAAELNGETAKELPCAHSITAHLAVCRLWSDRYDEFITKRQGELRRLARVSLQNAISGPAIYAAFLAQDVTSLVGAYRLQHSVSASNANSFAGAIAPTAASGISAALTAGWFLDDEFQWHKLRRQQALPLQLIQRRLTTLDELEQMLDQAHKH